MHYIYTLSVDVSSSNFTKQLEVGLYAEFSLVNLKQEALIILQSHLNLQYSPIKEVLGCSKKNDPPLATTNPMRRMLLRSKSGDMRKVCRVGLEQRESNILIFTETCV